MRSAVATCSKTVQLPTAPDSVAAAPPIEVLTSSVGTDIVIDGSRVEQIGGVCPQILLAALSTWRADGVPLEFSYLSSDLVAGLELLGIRPQHLLDRELSQ
jgi:chemotaxis protein CheX